MKRLMPSLRSKKRYVSFEVVSEATFGLMDVKKAVWSGLLRLFGELGSAKIDVHFLDETWKGDKGIVRCSHKCVSELLSSFALVDSINGKKCVLRSLKTSNTVKGAGKPL